MATNVINGKNIVFALRFTDDLSAEQTLRVLNQTGGGRSKSWDEIEIETKDLSATEPGKKTETISFEGLMTNGDTAYEKLNEIADAKELAEILEINIDTKEAKVGLYMISNIEEEFGDESATYTFDAKLSGETSKETLTVVPAGDSVVVAP